jgi:hypothetical protein
MPVFKSWSESHMVKFCMTWLTSNLLPWMSLAFPMWVLASWMCYILDNWQLELVFHLGCICVLSKCKSTILSGFLPSLSPSKAGSPLFSGTLTRFSEVTFFFFLKNQLFCEDQNVFLMVLFCFIFSRQVFSVQP